MSNPFVYETAAEWEKYPQNKKKGVATMTKWWLCGVALAITVAAVSVMAGVAATPDSGEVSSVTRAAKAAAPPRKPLRVKSMSAYFSRWIVTARSGECTEVNVTSGLISS